MQLLSSLQDRLLSWASDLSVMYGRLTFVFVVSLPAICVVFVAFTADRVPRANSSPDLGVVPTVR